MNNALDGIDVADGDSVAGGLSRVRIPCGRVQSCAARSLRRLLAWARTLIRVDGFPVKVFPESVIAPVFGGDPLTSLGISGANLECT